jgi:hypothetical protein
MSTVNPTSGMFAQGMGGLSTLDSKATPSSSSNDLMKDLFNASPAETLKALTSGLFSKPVDFSSAGMPAFLQAFAALNAASASGQSPAAKSGGKMSSSSAVQNAIASALGLNLEAPTDPKALAQFNAATQMFDEIKGVIPKTGVSEEQMKEVNDIISFWKEGGFTGNDLANMKTQLEDVFSTASSKGDGASTGVLKAVQDAVTSAFADGKLDQQEGKNILGLVMLSLGDVNGAAALAGSPAGQDGTSSSGSYNPGTAPATGAAGKDKPTAGGQGDYSWATAPQKSIGSYTAADMFKYNPATSEFAVSPKVYNRYLSDMIVNDGGKFNLVKADNGQYGKVDPQSGMVILKAKPENVRNFMYMVENAVGRTMAEDRSMQDAVSSASSNRVDRAPSTNYFVAANPSFDANTNNRSYYLNDGKA